MLVQIIKMQWLLTDGGSLKRPYEPSPYDSHPVKSATVISDSSLLGQPSLSEAQPNAGIKQQQVVFQPVPEKNPLTVDATALRRSSTGAVAVSGPELAIKQEVRPPAPVLPAVTPSLVPIPVTYATGMLEQRAVGAAVGGLHSVAVSAGGVYVTNAVPLNPSVIQFLQQQQPVMQAGSVPVLGSVPNVGSAHTTVNNILAAAAAPKPVSTDDNVNVQMLLKLLNRGGNKAAGVGTVQWAPAPLPAHSSNTPPTVQTQSPFIVQNFASVAPVPQDLSSQQVFSLSRSTSFTAPSVVSHGMTPAVVSSVLIATSSYTSPQLAHHLTAADQVLNLTVHSGSQCMDTNVSQSYSGSLNASHATSFSPTAFVASAGEKTPAFCDMAAVSATPSTYAEPMALATHFASESEPPPLKTICMTNSNTDAVNQVLVHQRVSDMQQENSLSEKLYVNAIDTSPPAAIAQPQFAAVESSPALALNDAHSFASNVIVHMDVTSSPHPPTKHEQTSTTELPHEINASGIIGGNLEHTDLFLTSSNNPMLAETSSQAQPQSADELQSFSSPSLLGIDIGSGLLTGLSVAAEPATLNVVSLPATDNSASSMSSNLQQSLAELLDLQQQLNAVTVPVTQSAQPTAVLDSPLSRELPPVPSESMQWASSTASHGQTTTAQVPAESNVVLASASVGTINLLTAAEVLSNATYRQEANHDVFYTPQPAVVIGSAGNSQETSATGWNQQVVQSPYAALAAGENAHVEIKQEQLPATGDVMLDLLSTMSTPTARTADSQMYTQQTSGEVTSDYFNSSNATSPVTCSSALPGTASSNSAQSQDLGIVQYAASQQIQPAAGSDVHSPSGVIYVVNQIGVDNSGPAQEPVSQPITYHIVTANQLPNCNQSQDIGIVQYTAPAQIQPAAGTEVHSPTSGGFRVLTADTASPPSNDPSSGGLQFQLSQPMSFGSRPLCCYCFCVHGTLLADVRNPA